MRTHLEREIRQFRRLVQLSYRRMLDAALGSRDIDAEQFVIWGGALAATPLLFYTLKTTSAYPWLEYRSLEALQDWALSDRLFFVVWAMLAAMLLVSLFWDGLFPDRTDQQVLGVLPVKSRTVAAARVSTALVIGCAFIAAINVPTAVVYGLFGATHPVVGSRTGVFTGHMISTVSAGMFTLCSLLTLRGLLVFLVGARAAARVALLLQLVTVLLIVETFLFLPGILPAILRPILSAGSAADSWLPPAWFLGLYTSFAGPRAALFADMAPRALAALGLVSVTAVTAYIAPAPWNARRAIEARASDRRGRIGAWLSRGAACLVRSPASKALVLFTLRSLARNSRPLLIMATWLGLAIAVAGLRLVSASVRGRPLPLDVPADYLIALPLVLTFFLAGGLRAAFAVPTDLPANWVFRLTMGGPPRTCLNAVRVSMWVVAVLPVSLLVALVGGWLWGLVPGLLIAAMHAASGVLLCELALVYCESIPFTRGRAVSSTSLSIVAPMALVGLNLYAFQLDDVQLLALRTENGVWMYMAIAVLAALAIREYGLRRQRPPTLAFDAPADPAVTQISLSEATG